MKRGHDETSAFGRCAPGKRAAWEKYGEGDIRIACSETRAQAAAWREKRSPHCAGDDWCGGRRTAMEAERGK